MPAPVNLHWKYFYDYFRSQAPLPTERGKAPEKPWYTFTGLDTHKAELLAIRANQYRDALNSLLVGPSSGRFSLKTTYPGLLVGSGYRHETGSKDELKLGFSFDYTTGLPIIPGSSVKGLLRSAFPGNPDRNQLHHRAKAFIQYLLQSSVGLTAEQSADIKIEALESEVFGHLKDEERSKENIPLSEGDIFYDALIGIDMRGVAHAGQLFGDDFITPHRNRKNPRMSPFTNPIPIQFLKIMPEVPITFQFDLRGTKAGLTPEQRKILFSAIIGELGVGAKTRVGYGRLVD
ncbi:type III-B CRISPR module RAMP protein Cmr6 [Spirosoma litoris]